ERRREGRGPRADRPARAAAVPGESAASGAGAAGQQAGARGGHGADALGARGGLPEAPEGEGWARLPRSGRLFRLPGLRERAAQCGLRAQTERCAVRGIRPTPGGVMELTENIAIAPRGTL